MSVAALVPIPRSVTLAESEGLPSLRGRVLREPAIAGATVLLTEDDDHCRASLRRQLVRARFEVYEAANGLEALDILDRYSVDVLATDLYMPAMGGLALIAALAGSHPNVPIVAYSGSHQVDPVLRDRLAARYVPLLLKPFPAEALIAALRDAMRPGGSLPSA